MADGVFFGAAERARFGWLHAPAAGVPATGVGLVIVPPFGYEAVCAFRALRVLAERAAATGLVAVQFDLDGTGDSAGDDLDPDRLGAWLASIDDACELARGAGADRLVLAGVRLGAALAALAAARRGDVAAVIAIAAVPSGKTLVREMRALHAMVAAGFAPAPAPAPSPPGAGAATATDEVVGFALTAETRAALTAIDLVREPRAPAPAALVIDRTDTKANDAWVAALRAHGCAVTHAQLPGYPEMVLDPHHAKVPAAIVDAAVAFAATTPPLASAAPSARAVPHGAHATFGPVAEEVVVMPNGCRAIVSSTTAPPRRAVILVNAGSIRWIGPNRLYVALARRLAARGDLVIRVDLSGLGATPARGGAEDNLVYAPSAVRELGAAATWARRRGATEVAVAGLCSGAYHALRAAIDGYPIDVVVPINPLTFRYVPGMPLDAQPHKVAESTARYERSVRSLASWKKLLRGGVDLRRLAATLALRARDRGIHGARDAARALGVPLRDDLGTDLRALARRGVRVHFVFAADDPGQALLVEHAGRVVDQLVARGALAITTLAGPDHTFTPRWSHAPLLDALATAVGASP